MGGSRIAPYADSKKVRIAYETVKVLSKLG